VNRAYYTSTISDFHATSPDEILGVMTRHHGFDLNDLQRNAWIEQTALLHEALAPFEGSIYLEFAVPRMGKRIDAVVIIGPLVFVIEFKIQKNAFERADLDQVVDYALDLHNFHEGSHRTYIAPVLVCTEAPKRDESVPQSLPSDLLFEPSKTNAAGMGDVLGALLRLVTSADVSVNQWESSRYRPTPTIIEATLALYRGHSVVEIANHEAGENLSITSATVAQIIEQTRAKSQKAICFVTGVPGAGKTLVGLDAATKHIDNKDELYSVFLSGNGPLVAILQEALARDKVRRSSQEGQKIRKGVALSEVKAFIQNVHHFRDDCLEKPEDPPVEHVAIFDEAQRAWTLTETASFMKRKKGCDDFNQSEPEFLISCLDRHPDWAVVICLVGGGQEINRGEAGIREWLDSLEKSFPHWQVYVSDRLVDSEYSAGTVVDELRSKPHVQFRSELHLATSMRSFRSEHVSKLVKDVLDLDIPSARETLRQVQGRYPVLLTRDLDAARKWLRSMARGSERYGIVVSSAAERLKPHALDVKTKIDPVQWFLNGKEHVRSSYYLEDVATEFHVQGLELDWTCVVWDADFRYTGSAWAHWSFHGSKWQRVLASERQNYLKNAYRVLLTRARQGMVVVVPPGDTNDPTRPPSYYDPTYDYLASMGLEILA
jgi:hypothetical protein